MSVASAGWKVNQSWPSWILIDFVQCSNDLNTHCFCILLSLANTHSCTHTKAPDMSNLFSLTSFAASSLMHLPAYMHFMHFKNKPVYYKSTSTFLNMMHARAHAHTHFSKPNHSIKPSLKLWINKWMIKIMKEQHGGLLDYQFLHGPSSPPLLHSCHGCHSKLGSAAKESLSSVQTATVNSKN